MALQFPKGPHIQQQASPMRTATNILASIPQTLEAAKLKNINKELSNYFINNSMGEGGFSTATGDLTYESSYMLPSYQDAWNQYKGIHKKYGKSVGMENYGAFKQMYSEMAQMHASKLQSEIMKFSNAGYSQDEIRYALKDSPAFASNYSNLISDPVGGANYSSMFAPYAPKKGLLEGVGMRDASTGLGVVGACAVGVNYLLNRRVNAQISKADEILKTYKDSPEYKAAKGAGRAKITRETKAKVEQMKSDARAGKTGNLINRAKKLSGGAKLATYAIGTGLAKKAATELFDSEKAGEAIGAGAGAGLAGLDVATRIGPTIQNAIKKHGMKKIIKKVASVGGVKLAASMLGKGLLTGSGIGTVVGAGLLANDLRQIYAIIKDMD